MTITPDRIQAFLIIASIVIVPVISELLENRKNKKQLHR